MRSVTALILLLGAAPAAAEVVQATPAGFEITQTLDLEAPPPQVWAAVVQPKKWWDHDHTYSDDSANLTLDPVAGGCFCERLPDGGGVEHARVLYSQPPKMIRMAGSLGPLQAEAVTGTLTIRIEPLRDRGSRVTLSYVVGGYVRAGADTVAAKVDEVLAIQLLNLKTAGEAPVPRTAVPEGR